MKPDQYSNNAKKNEFYTNKPDQCPNRPENF